VKVLYFASARENIGNLPHEHYPIEAGITTLKELVESIKDRHHQNKNFTDILQLSMITVNEEYIYELSSVILTGTEEVAVIPPISGG
jgi:molybdopterin converting factor subunit 1